MDVIFGTFNISTKNKNVIKNFISRVHVCVVMVITITLADFPKKTLVLKMNNMCKRLTIEPGFDSRLVHPADI